MSIQYSEIPCKRKVVAKLTNCQDDVYAIVRKRFPDFVSINKESVRIRGTFKGTATCNPDDVYDLEVGKELARKRVLQKYNKAMAKALCGFDSVIDDSLSLVIDVEGQFWDKQAN